MAASIAAVAGPLLTEQGLGHIAAWRFGTGVQTQVDLLLQPLWNSCLLLVPRWLAPNCVTLLGGAPVVLCVVLQCLWCPSMEGAASGRMLMCISASTFFYLAMDNLDGKQARRTGSSSPLGHLVDHGLDSMMILPYSIVLQTAVAGLPRNHLMLLLQSLSQIAMLMSHWSEKHTGYCPVEGTTEMILGIVAITACAGIIEESTREAMFSSIVPFLAVDVRACFRAAGILCASVFALRFAVMTLRHSWKQGGSHLCGRVLLDLLPTISIVVGLFLWAELAVREATLPVLVLIGLVLIFQSEQFILFGMAVQPYPLLQPLCVLNLCTAAASNLITGVVPLRIAIWLAVMVTAVLLAFWHYAIIGQLTQKLSICFFRIRPE